MRVEAAHRFAERKGSQMPRDRHARMAVQCGVVLMLLMSSLGASVVAQDAPGGADAVPTTGGPRPGPQGLTLPVSRHRGVLPAAMQIPAIDVDAEVETRGIVDGAMQDPSGPWVVSWYQETALAGADGNAVFAGHVDYVDVGPAVFYGVKQLVEGDQIILTGEDGRTYTYAVSWYQLYPVAELTPETIQEIVGPTDEPSVTLITCGGDFNYATGEYIARYIVRATLVA